MAEIKSAFEKAMERAEQFGRLSGEEIESGVHLDQGRRLAARYLRQEDLNLSALLEAEPAEARPHVMKGVVDTLLRNIILPRDDDAYQNVKKAMKALLKLKKNNVKAQKLLGHTEEIIQHYRRTVQDAREQLKARFEARLGDLQRQLQSQAGTPLKIDVEKQPQFQDEWLQVSAEISDHYNKLMEQQKEALRNL